MPALDGVEHLQPRYSVAVGACNVHGTQLLKFQGGGSDAV